MTPQKFRRKTVEIDAARVDQLLAAAANDWAALPDWVREAYEAGHVRFLADAVEVTVKTWPGYARSERTGWIVRDERGDLHPFAPVAFEATYEPIPTAA